EHIMRFSAGKSFRRNDIYGQHYSVTWPGGYFRGTDGLPPQSVVNYELEYRTLAVPQHTIKIEAFQMRLKDAYFQNIIGSGPQIVKATTDNEYLIRGYIGEIQGWLFNDALRWYANITLYHAVDDTANLRMSDVPRYTMNEGIQYLPMDDLYLSLDVHHQDGFKAVTDTTITDNVNSLPEATGVGSFTTVDSKIGYSPCEDVELSLSVENLFNDRHYEFPLHQQWGRTLYVGVRIKW
ncbi:MAG: TonB-dependent receptor, partial [Planctomycetota bacterium]